MSSFQESMKEYKKQLQQGAIQQAYRGLMEYIMNLRTYFKNKYLDYFVSGSIYTGYMDMTYFSFIPKSLKHHSLKVAIVFVHEKFRFEAWLAAYNKDIQAEYWQLFSQKGWDKYQIVPSIEGVDAILMHGLVEDPDFSDLDGVTQQIENGVLTFIQDVEAFLAHR